MLVSGTGHFDGMGSNPTLVILHCYKLTVLFGKKQFENNQQHSFNCIVFIGRMAEWSKALVSGTSHFDGVGSNPTSVMLHNYKSTVLAARKRINSKIINNIPSTGVTILAGWPSGSKTVVSGTIHFDVVMVPLLQINNFSWKKDNSNIISNIPSTVLTIFNRIGRMAEFSKVLVSGSSHFDSMGSNPTLVIQHCYQFKVFTCQKNDSKIRHNITSTVLTTLAGCWRGLRCGFQEPVISMAWVRIPPLS